MTGQEICTTALIDAGILGVGEIPDSPMITEAVKTANRLLSSWSAQMQPIWSQVTNEFNLIAGKAQYTVGPTGDFQMPRPLEIAGCQLRLWTNFDYYVKVVAWADYQATLFKGLSGFPKNMGWNPTIPNGTIALYPTPFSNCQLRLTCLIAMDSMTLSADYAFPPGYEQAFIANLAIWLMTKYKLPVDPVLQGLAAQSKEIIDRANFNSQITEMSPDFSAPGYSGATGQWQSLWGVGFASDDVSTKIVIQPWAPGNGAEQNGNYALNEVTTIDGGYYVSLIGDNTDNPIDSPNWQSFAMNDPG